MCLIAYQPPGSLPLSADVFRTGWDNNKDGAGFMFAAGGKLMIRKPFFRLRDLKRAYKADHAAHGATSPFVVHFRWSTHGKNDETNTHPHELAEGRVGLVHNGVLREFDPLGHDISDTVLFCRSVLANRQPSQLMSRRFNAFLAELIGAGNKFVLMDNRGAVSIVNADAGVWEDGVWFSNEGHKPKASGTLRGFTFSSGKGAIVTGNASQAATSLFAGPVDDGREWSGFQDIDDEDERDTVIEYLAAHGGFDPADLDAFSTPELRDEAEWLEDYLDRRAAGCFSNPSLSLDDASREEYAAATLHAAKMDREIEEAFVRSIA